MIMSTIGILPFFSSAVIPSMPALLFSAVLTVTAPPFPPGMAPMMPAITSSAR